MADREIWNLGGPVAIAAAVRMAAATGPLAGGYVEMGSLFSRWAASGNFRAEINNPTRGIVAVLRNFAAAGQLGCQMEFTQSAIANWAIGQPAGQNAFAFFSGRSDGSDGTEVMRIAGGGDVGIGTTAITAVFGRTLQIGNGGLNATMSLVGTGGSGYMATFGNSLIVSGRAGMSLSLGTNDATKATITTSGRLGVGTSTPAEIIEAYNATGGSACYVQAGNPAIAFLMGVNGTACELKTSQNVPIRLVQAGVNRWQVASTALEPGSDNAYNIGHGSFRVAVVYAATGTINTSDARDKKWRGRLTKAELAAGLAVLEELGFYQWLDQIAEKGAGDARFHYGARAQEVWRIFAEHKLVAPIKRGRPGKTPYAFLCWDKWEDRFEPIMAEKKIRKVRPVLVETKVLGPDGAPAKIQKDEVYFEVETVDTGKKERTRKAGDRFGLRPDQLALFLVACIDERSRLEKAEADERLAALEAALAELKKAA